MLFHDLTIFHISFPTQEETMPFANCPNCHNACEVPPNGINCNVQCRFCGTVFTAFENSVSQEPAMCTYGNKSYTKKEIAAIAKNQRLFLLFLGLSILFFILVKFFDSIPEDEMTLGTALIAISVCLGLLACNITEIVFFVKMLIALKTETALVVVLAILTFLPCIGFIIAIIYSQKATNALRAAGIRQVGLLGAPGSVIRDLENS